MANTEVERERSTRRVPEGTARSTPRHPGLSRLSRAIGQMLDVADDYVEEATAAIREGVGQRPLAPVPLAEPVPGASRRQFANGSRPDRDVLAGFDRSLREVEALVESIQAVTDQAGRLVARHGAALGSSAR